MIFAGFLALIGFWVGMFVADEFINGASDEYMPAILLSILLSTITIILVLALVGAYKLSW